MTMCGPAGPLQDCVRSTVLAGPEAGRLQEAGRGQGSARAAGVPPERPIWEGGSLSRTEVAALVWERRSAWYRVRSGGPVDHRQGRWQAGCRTGRGVRRGCLVGPGGRSRGASQGRMFVPQVCEAGVPPWGRRRGTPETGSFQGGLGWVCEAFVPLQRSARRVGL